MGISATARGKESAGEKGFTGAFLSSRMTGGCVDEAGIRGTGKRGAVACMDSGVCIDCIGTDVAGSCADCLD